MAFIPRIIPETRPQRQPLWPFFLSTSNQFWPRKSSTPSVWDNPLRFNARNTLPYRITYHRYAHSNARIMDCLCIQGHNSPCALHSRHTLTSRGGALGNTGIRSHWKWNRTKRTCCRPGRACAAGPGRMRTRGRSSTNRTIRSASRRRGVHEAYWGHTHIHAHSSCFRSVCIL